MLVLHIGIALASILWTTILFLGPTRAKLYGSYGLIAGTLASGTLLILSTGAPLIKACVTGLVYLSIVSFMVALSARKLAGQEQEKQ